MLAYAFLYCKQIQSTSHYLAKLKAFISGVILQLSHIPRNLFGLNIPSTPPYMIVKTFGQLALFWMQVIHKHFVSASRMPSGVHRLYVMSNKPCSQDEIVCSIPSDSGSFGAPFCALMKPTRSPSAFRDQVGFIAADYCKAQMNWTRNELNLPNEESSCAANPTLKNCETHVTFVLCVCRRRYVAQEFLP